jgi:hypothetical protein
LVGEAQAGGHRLELWPDDESGFFVSQVADLPSATMAGVELELTATVEVADGSTWAAVVLAALYSLYDQTYFGAPAFFQEAFRTIGVHRLGGTPKEAWRLLRHLRWLRDEPVPTGIAPAAQCAADPRDGGAGRRAP